MTDLLHVGAGQHRLGDFQTNRRIDVGVVQQVRLGTDEGHQGHNQLFADRVDRRIGHLGEQLLEVGVEGLGLGRQDRQGRVVTHGAGSFFAVVAHRLQNDLDVFLGEAESLLAVEQGGAGSVHLFFSSGHFVELDADLLDPLLIGLGLGQGVLQFLVVDDAALFHVDEEHLARLQAPLLDDLLLGNRQHAGFGSHDHEIIIGNQVTGRTQAVPVEGRTNLAAVGKGNGCGAVPRLHHGGVVLVEGATVLVHESVLFPGFGDEHHHGVGQGIAAHDQEFQGVVERGGIGLAWIVQGPDLVQIVAEDRRGDGVFAGLEPVHVAAHGVDFAVVGDHAERMGQIPGREGVGGEALVHQGQSRGYALVLQIQVIHAHLVGQQQTLVVDGARGQGRNVEFLAMLELQRLDGIGGAATNDVELALQGIGHEDVGTAAHEDLRRMTGSLALTAGDMGISALTGTSRQPNNT